MPKKGCLIVIFLSIIVNVVMLQWTIESYFGQEYKHVFVYSAISMVSVVITLASYFRWRMLEYKS